MVAGDLTGRDGPGIGWATSWASRGGEVVEGEVETQVGGAGAVGVGGDAAHPVQGRPGHTPRSSPPSRSIPAPTTLYTALALPDGPSAGERAGGGGRTGSVCEGQG